MSPSHLVTLSPGAPQYPIPNSQYLHSSPRTRPTLLITTHNRQETIARCCHLARHLGIRPAMTLAEARALAPNAHILPFDPEKSHQALDLLAKWCLRFSPVVSIDPTPSNFHSDPPPGSPDGLLLNVTGEAHLFGSEHLMLTEIATRLANLGFTARLAIAPTLGAAWALSHFAKNPLSLIPDHPPETSSQFPIPNSQFLPNPPSLTAALSPLPTSALRLPIPTCESLQHVGITLIKHLLALPRESLLARFGEDILLRLDQAFGRADELITPLRQSEPITLRRLFDGATTQLEAIFITVQELLGTLSEKLLAIESGVRGLTLELLRINAPTLSREFTLTRPSRDPKHLWQLIRPKLEQMHLGYCVEAVALSAHWTETIRHRQLGAWDTGEQQETHDTEYETLLDTLINRWGKSRVLTAKPIASHTPEVARHFLPVGDVEEKALRHKGTKALREEGGLFSSALAPLSASVPQCLSAFPLIPHDRPTLLFERPEPADALALQPDRPPSWLRWRNQEFNLQTGTGPERIVTAWWTPPRTLPSTPTHTNSPYASHTSHTPSRNATRSGASTASTRDYFKVQTTAGSWLWTFHELESGNWYVHGTWS